MSSGTNNGKQHNRKYFKISAYFLLLFVLIGFIIVSPSFFLNQQVQNIETNIKGHLKSHSEPESDCGFVDPNPIKKFTLVAQQVLWEVTPGETFQAWTFNGTLPGPNICLNKGDTLILTLENKLQTIASFHAHGLKREYSSDGTFMSTSFAVPGGSYTYTFEADELSVGTWAYHDAVAEMDEEPFFLNLTSPESGEGIERGLFGAIIVYGDQNLEPSDIDHEIILVEAEFESEVTLGPTYMTFNGKIFPSTPNYIFKNGEKIRFRIINVGPNAEHNILINGLLWKDTRTGNDIKSVFFGALEFGDFIVEASKLIETQYVCDIPGHIEQGMFGNFTIIP
jgi:FtsP/CotA-like multicopper oxidase with cupredoxin domain